MILDAIANALKASVVGTYSTVDTAITVDNNVFSGVTDDHNLILFDRKEGDPADALKAGRYEILRRDASADSGNILTLTRAQEGTSAITIDGTGQWVLLFGSTKAVFDQIKTAIEDLETGKADSSHTHSASDVTSGSFANARISASSVTQHEGAINHNSLLNYNVAEHRTIDDAGSGSTDLWSAQEIITRLSTKSDTSHTHPASAIVSGTFVDARIPDLSTSKITSGTFADARIAQSNVTQYQANLSIGASQITGEIAFTTLPTGAVSEWDFDASGGALVFRTTANPANGGRIFEVHSSGASTRFYVEHAGAIGTSNDTIELSDGATSFNTTDVANWNTAFGWGNHASAGYASSVHTHSASDITSGTFADARISSSSVTQHEGSLTLSASQVTSGTFGTARIPSLDASKITTGTFGTARIPNLATSKITSGTFANARISESSVTQHEDALAVYSYTSKSSNYTYSPASDGHGVQNTSASAITGTVNTGLNKSALFVQSGAGIHNISAGASVTITGPTATDGQDSALLLIPSPTSNEYFTYLVATPSA